MIEVYAYLRGEKKDVDNFLKYGDKESERRIKKQSLGKHIEDSIKALENEIKNTKIWKYYVTLNNYGEEHVKKWTKFIIVFHDLGKIFYQRNVKLYINKEYLNFAGHEFISTFLADKFLELWLKNNIEDRFSEYTDFRWVIIGSILYHHHALGLKKRERLNEIKVCMNHEEFKKIIEKSNETIKNSLKVFEEEVISQFVSELEAIEPERTNAHNMLVLSKDRLSDIYRYVSEGLNEKIWEKFIGDKKHNKGSKGWGSVSRKSEKSSEFWSID
jgi:CRISPR-associated endonuclease Cas3-HD